MIFIKTAVSVKDTAFMHWQEDWRVGDERVNWNTPTFIRRREKVDSKEEMRKRIRRQAWESKNQAYDKLT